MSGLLERLEHLEQFLVPHHQMNGVQDTNGHANNAANQSSAQVRHIVWCASGLIKTDLLALFYLFSKTT